MKSKFRVFCALLAWGVILAQYIILINDGEYGGLASTSLAYFGFFTIQTNILVALAFSAPLLKPESAIRRFFERQSVRAAIALYILVVAVIYYALLAKDHNPEGLSAMLNIGLHLVLPVLYIFDWLVFAPKKSMPFKTVPLWVVFPAGYGVFNIIRGAINGFYPYPFLNVAELGLGGVFSNMMGFVVFYAIGGFVFVSMGRVLPDPN